MYPPGYLHFLKLDFFYSWVDVFYSDIKLIFELPNLVTIIVINYSCNTSG